MNEKIEQRLGVLSNALTDLTIQGASPEKMAPIVAESMLLIEKRRANRTGRQPRLLTEPKLEHVNESLVEFQVAEYRKVLDQES